MGVILPNWTKETRSFDTHFDRGIRWYLRHDRQPKQDQCVGEVAPTYFCSGKACERIARFLAAGRNSSIAGYKSPLVIVIGCPKSHDNVLVIDSVSIGGHAVGVIKRVVFSVPQQRSVGMKVAVKPLKNYVV